MSRRVFSCCEIPSLKMAISVLLFTMARTVSSRRRATFSTCSRYLNAKKKRTPSDEKEKLLMTVWVRTQSVGPAVGTESRHRWKGLPSVPDQGPARDVQFRRCSRWPLSVRPAYTWRQQRVKSQIVEMTYVSPKKDLPLGDHLPAH